MDRGMGSTVAFADCAVTIHRSSFPVRALGKVKDDRVGSDIKEHARQITFDESRRQRDLASHSDVVGVGVLALAAECILSLQTREKIPTWFRRNGRRAIC